MVMMFNRNPQPITKVPEQIYGYWMQGGRATPIKSTGLGGGFNGMSIQSQIRARRELNADDMGLSLAYANPTVNRCIDLRARKFAQMPHKIVRRGTKEVIEDHPFYDALRSHRLYYKKNLLYLWQSALCLHGEAYFEKISDQYGRPLTFRWLNPMYVEPEVMYGTVHRFYFSDGDSGHYDLAPQTVIYDYYHNPMDDWRGLSPTQVALTSVNIENGYDEFINSYYKNDATPGGILAAKQGTSINQTDSKRLMQWWIDQLQGARNKFKTIFLPAALEYQQIQSKPAAEMTEQSRAAMSKICKAFGVPAPLVEFDENRFQMSSEHAKQLYENCIIPECEEAALIINDEMMPFLDPDGDAEFIYDYDKIRALIDDQVKRTTSINARQMAGNITLNEARAQFGDAPVNGGDVFFIPKANQPVPLADLPTVAEILAIDDPNAQGAPEENAVPRQDSAERELKAWENKAINNGVKKARKFVAYTLPATIADRVRAELHALPDTVTKDALRAVFRTARAELKSVFDEDDMTALVERLQDLRMTDLVSAA